MQLAMYLGNDCIAAVRINTLQIAQPGYLGKLKRKLMNEHQVILKEAAEKPEFLLVQSLSGGSPARMETDAD